MAQTASGIEVVETDDIDGAVARADVLPATLPVLPLKEAVAYPDTLMPLAVGQERSVRLIDDVLAGGRTLVLVASLDSELEEPGPDDLHDVGVLAVIARMLKVPDGRCGCSSRRPSGSASSGTSPSSRT